MEYTGINAVEHGLPRTGTWWHFGRRDEYLTRYKPHAHIPIRHPLDVAKSWARRNKTGDVLSSMLNAYESMFWFLDWGEYTLYRMEDLPTLAGTGESTNKAEKKTEKFLEAVKARVILPNKQFFERFYQL